MADLRNIRAQCVLSHIYDPSFYYSLDSSYYFCRPHCGVALSSSVTLLTNENSSSLRFFDTVLQALNAGLKPCHTCLSDLSIAAAATSPTAISAATGSGSISSTTTTTTSTADNDHKGINNNPNKGIISPGEIEIEKEKADIMSSLDDPMTSVMPFNSTASDPVTGSVSGSVAGTSTDFSQSNFMNEPQAAPSAASTDPAVPASSSFNAGYQPFPLNYDLNMYTGSRSLSASPAIEADALFMKHSFGGPSGFGSNELDPLTQFGNFFGGGSSSSSMFSNNALFGNTSGGGFNGGVNGFDFNGPDSGDAAHKAKHHRSTSTVFADDNGPTSLEEQGWRPRRASIANGHIPAAAAVVDQIIRSAADNVRNDDAKAQMPEPSGANTGSNKHKGMGDHLKLVDDACRHIAEAAAAAAAAAAIAATNNDSNDDPGSSSTGPGSNSASGMDLKQPLKLQRKKRRGGILGFKELASKAGLSPWHFHRVFRSVTGLTPKAYGEACWNAVIADPSLPAAIANGHTTTGPLAESAVTTVGTGSNMVTSNNSGKSTPSSSQFVAQQAAATPSDNDSAMSSLPVPSALSTPATYSPVETNLMANTDPNSWITGNAITNGTGADAPIYTSAGTSMAMNITSAGDFTTLGSDAATPFGSMSNSILMNITSTENPYSGTVSSSLDSLNHVPATLSDVSTIMATSSEMLSGTPSSSTVNSLAPSVSASNVTSSLDNLDSFVTASPQFDSMPAPMINRPSANSGYSINHGMESHGMENHGMENHEAFHNSGSADWSMLAGNPFNMPSSTPVGSHSNLPTPTLSSARPGLSGSALSFEGSMLPKESSSAAVLKDLSSSGSYGAGIHDSCESSSNLGSKSLESNVTVMSS